jgi:hypothetical protein
MPDVVDAVAAPPDVVVPPSDVQMAADGHCRLLSTAVKRTPRTLPPAVAVFPTASTLVEAFAATVLAPAVSRPPRDALPPLLVAVPPPDFVAPMSVALLAPTLSLAPNLSVDRLPRHNVVPSPSSEGVQQNSEKFSEF